VILFNSTLTVIPRLPRLPLELDFIILTEKPVGITIEFPQNSYRPRYPVNPKIFHTYIPHLASFCWMHVFVVSHDIVYSMCSGFFVVCCRK